MRQKQVKSADVQLSGALGYALTIALGDEGHYKRKAGAGALLHAQKQETTLAKRARDTVKSYWSFTK